MRLHLAQLGLVALLLGNGAAAAQSVRFNETTLLLLTDPLDPNLLDPEAIPADSGIVTAERVEQDPAQGLTLPSLWWTQFQFDRDKLLDTWIANPGLDGTPPRVDLVANQQIWGIYNYLERYTILSQFGSAARDFGYSTRIFNRQQELLAAYICTDLENGTCTVFLDPFGPGGLQGGGTTLIAPLSIDDGTAPP